ncbi:MAG: hypothetical protein FWD91_07680, partial [Treponema sp.]|nr:hypothetical protein [Treponema sp.]
MNKIELRRFFNTLFEGLSAPGAVPLLLDIADAAVGQSRGGGGALYRRMERLYARLCRLQGELSHLDLKKARLGATLGIAGYKTLEDFAFSSIDFSRYRLIPAENFESLFPESLTDFDDSFFRKSFGVSRQAVKIIIEKSYEKTDGGYRLRHESALILSAMRALETSLNTVPLFTAANIAAELRSLPAVQVSLPQAPAAQAPPDIKRLCQLVVRTLDNAEITHHDGATTKLFISA